jgi:NADPH:quinone reductase-like Zn-dependent oxidoreductase
VHAIRQRRLGGPEVLELADVPRPEPGPTEVLVRVASAGVNPVDWKVRARGGLLGEPPFTVGWDVAGVVEEIGRGVTRFAPGDRVFGMPRFPHEAAAYAEYITSPSRQLARVPEGLSDVEAGGLPLVGLTAWQALAETADVQPGQRVLILAAAGGVGHVAVQIAKARGAYVLGTARNYKHDFLNELGIDEAIDYTTDDVVERAGEVDIVLDLVGDDNAGRSVTALTAGGTFIRVPSASNLAGVQADAADGVRVTGILVEPDRQGMEALADLVERGALRVHVQQTFPLAEAARAHELGEAGRVQGKLVLTVD